MVSLHNWLVVSTHLKNISQDCFIFPKFRGENSKNIWVATTYIITRLWGPAISCGGWGTLDSHDDSWFPWINLDIRQIFGGGELTYPSNTRWVGFQGGWVDSLIFPTRWAPTSYKWSYNPYKWPYNWVTGVITTISGLITILITGRGPTL